MKKIVFAILMLCIEAVQGQSSLQLTKLNLACDSIILETRVHYPLGSGLMCPPLVGYPTSIQGDTLVLSLYYDVSGGWLAFFCTSIHTINIVVPPSASILLGKTYSINSTPTDTTNVISTDTLQLCLFNSNNEIPLIENKIIIYPNPFHSSTTINTKENGIFICYNALGKLVFQEQINDTLTVISRGKLEAGIYFYQFVNDKNVVTRGKFIVD